MAFSAAATAAEVSERIVVPIGVEVALAAEISAETAATRARRIAGVQRVLTGVVAVRNRLLLRAAGFRTGLFARRRARRYAIASAGIIAEFLVDSHAEKH